MVEKKESERAGSANAKPAPGPWEVLMSNPLRLGDGILRPQIWAVNGGRIAICDATKVGSDAAEANARLMAAAPQLAEALAAMLAAYGPSFSELSDEDRKVAEDMAESALKAAGWEGSA